MAIDASGKLFAFHRAEPPIIELDPSGKILHVWRDKLFAWPHGIRVDRFGNLWITDGRRVTGRFLKAWGNKGDQPAEFNLPHTIAIDSRGRVLVGDRSNNRIQIFDQEGNFLDQLTQFGTPSGIYITPDDTLYVVDYNVKKGVLVGSAKDGSVKYKLDDAVAEGVAVDSDGNVMWGRPSPGQP